jgi:hypothetical protein
MMVSRRSVTSSTFLGFRLWITIALLGLFLGPAVVPTTQRLVHGQPVKNQLNFRGSTKLPPHRTTLAEPDMAVPAHGPEEQPPLRPPVPPVETSIPEPVSAELTPLVLRGPPISLL